MESGGHLALSTATITSPQLSHVSKQREIVAFWAIIEQKKHKGHQSTVTLAKFWYRLVCVIAITLCAIIGAIWLAATFVVSDSRLDSLHVSTPAIIMLALTAVSALAGTIIQREKHNAWITFSTILALSTSILLTIASTGDLVSPFLAFWMLVALFSGLIGIRTLLPVLALVALYGYGLWLDTSPTFAMWVMFAITFILPMVVSYFAWARRFQTQENSNNSQVSALTKELDQESNKADIVISAITDGVIAVDARGIIQLINPAAQRIIGWAGEDAATLDYRSVLKIVNSKNEVVADQIDPVQKCLRINEPVKSDQLGIRTVSGKQLLASILVSPIGNPGSGAIVVFRDTTAQHAEEREQAEFISTASHEMRTPVAAIEGYLGLALNPQTATIDEKARSYLAKAHEAAQHLGRLFQDLLDVSKAEDGRLNSKPTITDVTAFVRTVLEDFHGQFSEKGLSLIFKPQTAAQTITPFYYANVDLDHLREVVANLVTNAIKYTKEGSVIVDVTADNSNVYISVKDTGIGIPAEDIPHLFQKFYRVDNTDTREIGGTGLGLYLARRLCEAMDGNLTLTSAYGEGSTFTISIPRVAKEEALRPAQSTPAPSAVVPATATPAPQAVPAPAITPLNQAPPVAITPATPPIQTPPATPSLNPETQTETKV